MPGRHETIRRPQRALEALGIEFINSDRPGVRMRLNLGLAVEVAASGGPAENPA